MIRRNSALLLNLTDSGPFTRSGPAVENNRAADATPNLNEREREVMRLVVEGNTNKSVTAELGISEKTLEVRRSRVIYKTGANSFSDLIRTCLILNEKF